MDPAKPIEPGERVAGVPRKEGSVTLSHRYLAAVSRLETLPTNQPGTDKSWVESTLREFRELLTRAKRVR